MFTWLLGFATLCLIASGVIWWNVTDRRRATREYCEVREAYEASLWVGMIALGILLCIGATGVGLLWLSLRWLHCAVRACA
jgi:hypothetical protein